MKETDEKSIIQLHTKQRQFFATHQTKDIPFRLKQLQKLKKIILLYFEE